MNLVRGFKNQWGRDFPDDEAKIQYIISLLEDEAADSATDLYEAEAPELEDFDEFMFTLRT